MRKIIWSSLAREDLRRINHWLINEASPELALRTLATIRFRCKSLEDFPHGGPPLNNGARKLRVHDTPYFILYRIIRSTVEVARIVHEREDWLIDP